MNCIRCGMKLEENDMFCRGCGTPVQNVNNQNMYNYENNVNQQPQYRPIEQNYGQPYSKSKNTGDIVKICVAVLIAIIVFIGIAFGVNAIISKIDNNNDDNKNNNNDNYGGISTSGQLTEDNKQETVTPVSNEKSSSYKINYGGFKFYIPDNLIYEMDYTNDYMMIGDEEQTWMATMKVVSGSFQQIKNKKNYLSTSIMEQANNSTLVSNVTASNATLETVGGVEYVLLEVNIDGINTLFVYASLNSMYTLCLQVYNDDNDFDREPLKDISTIISNTEYVGDSQYLKSNESIKIIDNNKVFEKIIETKNDE